MRQRRRVPPAISDFPGKVLSAAFTFVVGLSPRPLTSLIRLSSSWTFARNPRHKAEQALSQVLSPKDATESASDYLTGAT